VVGLGRIAEAGGVVRRAWVTRLAETCYRTPWVGFCETMNFRKFAPGIEDIALGAIASPILDDEFDQLSPASSTADGAFQIGLRKSDRMAFAKPSKNHDRAWKTVVHEKIASDLAFDLGLPVPPVHVLRGTARAGMAPWLAVSYIVFPEPRPFSDRKKSNIPDEYWQRFNGLASAMRVFYTWINDVDHGGHEQNFLFGKPTPDAEIELAFIDHSYSLAHSARKNDHLAKPIHQLFSQLDQTATREIATQIIAFPKSRIEYLVNRLEEILPAGTGTGLVQLLEDGKEVVSKTTRC